MLLEEVFGIYHEERIPVLPDITCLDDSDFESCYIEKNNEERVGASGIKSYFKSGKNNNRDVKPYDVAVVKDARRYQIWPKNACVSIVHSYEITSILVRGQKTLCVVTRDKSQDMKLFRRRLDYMLTAYNEGCWNEEDEMKPFACVTLFVGTDKVGKPSSINRFGGTLDALKFLAAKIKMDLAFSYEETVQTAISALKYLYGEDLQANEIEVRVFREGSLKGSLEVEEIEEHLSRV